MINMLMMHDFRWKMSNAKRLECFMTYIYGEHFSYTHHFSIYTTFRMFSQFVPESLLAVGSLHTVNRVWANCDLCRRLASSRSIARDLHVNVKTGTFPACAEET